MYHLIKKDILMQKKALKLSILLMLFFTITLVNNLGEVGLSVGIMAITYQLVLGTSALEDKDNSDIILVSLPIKKNTIILSKYVSIYVFTAYSILIYYLVYLIAYLFNLPLNVSFTAMGLMGTLASITLYFSISFPLVFKYGYLKSKMANMLLFFIVIFGGIPIIDNLIKNDKNNLSQTIMDFINQRSDIQMVMIVLIPLIIIVVISYSLSLTFYNKREF